MISFLIRLISHGARLKRGYNDQMRNQSYSYCDSPEKRRGEIKRIYMWMRRDRMNETWHRVLEKDNIATEIVVPNVYTHF